MIDRAELDQWLREHGYALVTSEQVARMERMVEGGAVPWDEHRRALAKADAELVGLRARMAQLETTGRALLAAAVLSVVIHGYEREVPVYEVSTGVLDEFRAVLDGNATPADREDPTKVERTGDAPRERQTWGEWPHAVGDLVVRTLIPTEPCPPGWNEWRDEQGQRSAWKIWTGPEPMPDPGGPFPIPVDGGQLWPGQDGTWQASDGGGWLPGIYADEASARKAIAVAQTDYGALAAAVDADVRGIGDDYRPVTVSDLRSL